MKVYKTSHACHPNQAKEDRYWVADDSGTKLKLIHVGVCDIDHSFLSLLVTSLKAELIELDMPDDAFKKLMLAEGYEQ